MTKFRIILVVLLIAFTASASAFALAAGIISWQDAGNYYGHYKTVEGTIVVTHKTEKIIFLNFSQNWKHDFTAVIFASDWHKFPPNPETCYKGRKVQVTGLIKEYEGKPEIILNWQSQIKVVE
ncbi:MAG: DNA-binding protein [Firmicutes bacterium]|nr:DNA-binding protein [Bacillota bacterium]